MWFGIILKLILIIAIHIKNVYGVNPLPPESRDCKSAHISTCHKGDTSRVITNIILKPMLNYRIKYDDVLTICAYNLNLEEKSVLRYPNKIRYINFNNNILPFSHEAILPSRRDLRLVDILMTDANIPVLIEFYSAEAGTYYFSPDPRTGMWKNYRMDCLEKFKRPARNGLVRYMFTTIIGAAEYIEKVKEEAIRLSQILSKVNNAIIDLPKEPFLEIGLTYVRMLNDPDTYA